MPLDAYRPDLKIGIAGTGIMGQGIAQIAAAAGMQAVLFDARAGAADTACRQIADVFKRLADKGKLSAEAAAANTQRLSVAADALDLRACDVVVEAIVEDLNTKKALFAELEHIVGADCVLATNTSSLSVTAIAAGLQRPERVAGFHFFNPVPLMKIVEVVDGLLTEPAVSAFLLDLGKRMGHSAVRAKDTPGFIVNHAGRGYVTEGLRVLSEGVAPFHQIDRILRDTAGFRLGPFELFDLMGLDVSHPVMESIYNQYYQEPRYRPSPLTRQMLAAGLFGRKTARGFYRHDDGVQEKFDEAAAPDAQPKSVWVSARHPAARRRVVDLLHALGAAVDDGERPAAGSLCIVTPVGEDATTCACREELDPARTIALETVFDWNKRRVLATTPATAGGYRDAAHALLARDGVPVSIIRDSAGLVTQRVVAHIANIACDIAQQGIASPADIDRAVTLGLGYPQGPLAWGDRLGAKTVLAILENMHTFYGDPRYRPSPWLKRRALLSLSLLSEEEQSC